MIGSEENLWIMFGGESAEEPGRWSRSFEYVRYALQDRTAFRMCRPVQPSMEALTLAKKLIKDVPLTDKTRFFLLVGRERLIRVDQSRLVEVGKAMRDPEMVVQYAGMVALDRSSEAGGNLRYVTEKTAG